MGRILENWRVFAAGIFAVVIIGGAYIFARDIESPQSAQASAETALLKAIATKDSDSDGLTDWEESLYGTDSHVADSFKLGMNDGDAVKQGLIVPKVISNTEDYSVTSDNLSMNSIDSSLPAAPPEGTLTAAFAQNFFSLYMAARAENGGEDLSESGLSDVSNKAIELIYSYVAASPDFKKIEDIYVYGSGADALLAFAAKAEAVLLKNTSTAEKSELVYLQEAVANNNDPIALGHIAELAKVYRESAAGLAVLAVPKELATEMLRLVNAMARISQISADFSRVDSDPLAAILALHQYPDAVSSMSNAFINIGDIYKAAGINLSQGTPGAAFVNMISDTAAQQKNNKQVL